MSRRGSYLGGSTILKFKVNRPTEAQRQRSAARAAARAAEIARWRKLVSEYAIAAAQAQHEGRALPEPPEPIQIQATHEGGLESWLLRQPAYRNERGRLKRAPPLSAPSTPAAPVTPGTVMVCANRGATSASLIEDLAKLHDAGGLTRVCVLCEDGGVPEIEAWAEARGVEFAQHANIGIGTKAARDVVLAERPAVFVICGRRAKLPKGHKACLGHSVRHLPYKGDPSDEGFKPPKFANVEIRRRKLTLGGRCS